MLVAFCCIPFAVEAICIRGTPICVLADVGAWRWSWCRLCFFAAPAMAAHLVCLKAVFLVVVQAAFFSGRVKFRVPGAVISIVILFSIVGVLATRPSTLQVLVEEVHMLIHAGPDPWVLRSAATAPGRYSMDSEIAIRLLEKQGATAVTLTLICGVSARRTELVISDLIPVRAVRAVLPVFPIISLLAIVIAPSRDCRPLQCGGFRQTCDDSFFFGLHPCFGKHREAHTFVGFHSAVYLNKRNIVSVSHWVLILGVRDPPLDFEILNFPRITTDFPCVHIFFLCTMRRTDDPIWCNKRAPARALETHLPPPLTCACTRYTRLVPVFGVAYFDGKQPYECRGDN
mmetsp:Transcript_64179/g.123466  ORF Transcript_64179/g.123466 Transcript_64179/m.123466 type:complete len:343 (-) Transcript_64179:152-1180(-)